MDNPFDYKTDIAWCPGCGNFAIRTTVLQALAESGLSREKVVFVSGIGQAAKAPQYMNVSYFNGLHGRALPAATGIKAANPGLTVVVESGDGDLYGEGGNHFIHAVRRNPDITVLAHNNMVYGLTKGQASPTSQTGMVTPIQVDGVFEEPLNPLALAIALNASFVARANADDRETTKEIVKKAIAHRGFALVDIFQACVSFNKTNTHQWFREHTVPLPDSHDPRNRELAFQRAIESSPWPLGIFFINEGRTVFEARQRVYAVSKAPLFSRTTPPGKIEELLSKKI